MNEQYGTNLGSGRAALVSILVLIGGVGMATAAASSPLGISPIMAPSATRATTENWEEYLKWLLDSLCHLVSCSDAGAAAMATVESEGLTADALAFIENVATSEIPPELTPGELGQALLTVDEATLVLTIAPEVLSEAVARDLERALSELRARIIEELST